MQPFFIIGGLLHATALAVIGFFVLFAASKSEGGVRRLGNILGVWLYILAVLALAGWIFLGAAANGPLGRRMMAFHHPWRAESAAPASVPAPAAPSSNAATPASATR